MISALAGACFYDDEEDDDDHEDTDDFGKTGSCKARFEGSLQRTCMSACTAAEENCLTQNELIAEKCMDSCESDYSEEDAEYSDCRSECMGDKHDTEEGCEDAWFACTGEEDRDNDEAWHVPPWEA